MPTLSKKPIKPTISDFSAQDVLAELGRQHKNLSSTVAKLNNAADTCNKALSNIADDLCPVVCANLISSHVGFTSSPVKLPDGSITSALKPVKIKFDKYCAGKFSCNYQDKDARFEERSSEDDDSSIHDNDGEYDRGSAGISGEAYGTDQGL